MALGSCYSCIKYLMFAFNFIFWLFGCSILGVGIWLRVDPNVAKYVNHAEDINIFFGLAYAMIVIGATIMIIGFLGCCGAIRESQCMLGSFFILLFIIFAVLLGFGIWAIVEKDMLQQEVGDMLQRAVDSYDTQMASRDFLDTIQSAFLCCGSRSGATDYGNPTNVPVSCAVEYRDEACEKKFFAWIAERLIVVAGISIGVSIVLILGMIFSMVMCCALRDVMD